MKKNFDSGDQIYESFHDRQSYYHSTSLTLQNSFYKMKDQLPKIRSYKGLNNPNATTYAQLELCCWQEEQKNVVATLENFPISPKSGDNPNVNQMING